MAKTREEWLNRAVRLLTPLFKEVGEEVPDVRVSVGWPGGRGKKDAVIGQCWVSHASKDKVSQIFVSPVLDDAAVVLSTLAHELVHAVDDCKSGHRGRFTKIAKAIGLEGKMTATTAGVELGARLSKIADRLGEYPHSALTPETAIRIKQTTRMLKVECPDCGYVVRTTQKWLDVGLPTCPCGAEMEQAA